MEMHQVRYFACANDRLYRRLVEVLGRPDLASGEFGDRRSRTANRHFNDRFPPYC